MLFMALLIACSKDEIPIPKSPQMRYLDLQNREVKFQQGYRIDLDGDNTIDFTFSTIHVGDPVLRRDRIQFFAASGFYSFLPIDHIENSKILRKGDRIGSSFPAGYTWYNVAFTVLAEKIIPETGETYWEGPCKNMSHQYLALQIEKNGARYFGWIELSMDKDAEKIILHRAAISIVEELDVAAGF